MKKVRLIATLMFFVIFSCNRHNNNKLDIFDTIGMDIEYLNLKAMLFIDPNTGFAAGSVDITTHNKNFPEKDSNTFAFIKRTALLFKTKDGGKNWTKKDLGEGSIIDIIQIHNKLFATKFNEVNSSYSIYSSNNLGESWNEEKTFPKRISRMFSLENGYLAITIDSVLIRTYINVSNDYGKSWKSFKSDKVVFDAVLEGDSLYFLSSINDEQYKKNLLVGINLKDSSEKTIELPKQFDCYFLTNYNGEIKLTGVENEHIAVYSVQKDYNIKYEYSYRKETGLFPQGFYHNKKEQWIVASKRNTTDVSNSILRTIDNGNSWEVIPFAKDKYIKPFCFYNDNGNIKSWFYAGSGILQVIK